MVTVVNSAPNGDDNNGMGFLIGAILIIFFGIMFFIYGLPMIRNAMDEGIQVKVNPEDINVNLEESPESTQ